MRRLDRRALLLVLTAGLMGFGGAAWYRLARPAPLAQALACLDRAAQLDAELEAATDPAAVVAQRDALLGEARTRLTRLLTRHPGLPEAELAMAQTIWRADSDLTAAWQHVTRAIDALARLPQDRLRHARPSGRTGAQVLAEAYAERAGYLLARLDDSAAGDDPLSRHSLSQATTDLAAAVALDPQPRYQQMQAGLVRLQAGAGAPFDPSTLTTRQAEKTGSGTVSTNREKTGSGTVVVDQDGP